MTPSHAVAIMTTEPDPSPRVQPDAPPIETQLLHVDAAWHLLSGKYPPARVAALYGVSVALVYQWKDRALTYDLPEAEGRLFGHPEPAPYMVKRMRKPAG
jgi:hypothetical protein